VEYDPDIVVLEGASWALYHRLLLTALRRRLPQVTVVYHAHNVEYDLRRAKSGRVIVALTAWAEGGLLRQTDHAFAVSTVDAQRFRELYNIECALLPNGVDVARFAAATPGQVEMLRTRYAIGPHAILFMGLYAYAPNTQAVRFLVDEVMPRVLATAPDAQLVVTGGEVPFRHPWLINPGVIPFDEVPAMIRACSVGTAPIFSGSGTRLKILECMAAGTPVVSTVKGAEGVCVVDGASILLAEHGEGFARAILGLWAEPRRAASLARKAQDLAQIHYDWPACPAELVRRCRSMRDLDQAKGIDNRPSG
jgi:glycosyltransferase involved in cell wall biosynthesis